MINADVTTYNDAQSGDAQSICTALSSEINANLPGVTNKVWHGAPVWFIDGNPIVGYWARKDSVQLLFWSGQSFDEPDLTVEGSFKAAEKRYKTADEINLDDLHRWLEKSQTIQWDYKNIVKRRGELTRLP